MKFTFLPIGIADVSDGPTGTRRVAITNVVDFTSPILTNNDYSWQIMTYRKCKITT